MGFPCYRIRMIVSGLHAVMVRRVGRKGCKVLQKERMDGEGRGTYAFERKNHLVGFSKLVDKGKEERKGTYVRYSDG